MEKGADKIMKNDTRLDDGAEIYQKREVISEKQKFNQLDRKGKLRYFKDYYLIKLLIGILIVSALGYIVYSVALKPKVETVYDMAIVGDQLSPEKLGQFVADVEMLLNVEKKKQDVLIDDSYMGSGGIDYTVEQRLMTYLYAGVLDVIVGDSIRIKDLARTGALIPLSELLPTDLYGKLSDTLVMETMEDDNREKAYGINLKDCERYMDFGGYMEVPVLGVVANSKNKENVVEVIKYLFDVK